MKKNYTTEEKRAYFERRLKELDKPAKSQTDKTVELLEQMNIKLIQIMFSLEQIDKHLSK